jgi:uncharacterized repeat protein (TIGR03803 family)
MYEKEKTLMFRQLVLLVTALMFAMVSSVVEAQTFCVLYAFSGGADGYLPYGGVVLGSSGSLYGTTSSGGLGQGVVFEVKKNTCNQTQDTVLHEFGSIKNDGLTPYDTLLIDPTGKHYLTGTTRSGGSVGNGTVFTLSIPGGGETIIDVEQNWGLQNPYAGLAETSSSFYGTAYNGGNYNAGGVFGPNGLVLHHFGKTPTDGQTPFGGVVVDSKGHIYGTTRYGGGGSPGNGIVYKVNTNNTGYKPLHRFLGTDGSQPYSKLLLDTSTGKLYGTTVSGGKFGRGTVFEMSPTTGEILRHYDFGTQSNDGSGPVGNLVMDANHNIFGTTQAGGANSGGVIFKLDSTFHLDVLHAFSYFDGTSPQGGLTMDSSGNLYGTTSESGVHASGTVFRLIR